ncbi:MAG: hypothetical protein QOE08_190 [Thermoleophilaceae bacterium]|nr:hypothetical protein [Thermoleophilaceae bacterium]
METLLVAAGVSLALYAAAVLALVLAGRRTEAIALARFIPDCVVLLERLVRDPRVSRRRRLALVLVGGYLAMPFDLVPDFIPVVGQVDDALLVAIALRGLLRGTGPELLRNHWPGPRAGLAVILRLARRLP